LLIERGADIDAKSFFDNYTPLLYATIKNNTEICKLLVEKGADVNAKNDYNITPLLLATIKKYTKIIDIFNRKNNV
jgi:ankyrin repeat protein